MRRHDRIQLEDLAVNSAQESHRLHPGAGLARHVRVALHTYRAGLPPDEPDPVLAAPDDREERNLLFLGFTLAVLGSLVMVFVIGYAVRW